MQIERTLLKQIQDWLLPGKVIILYGPRQVGKTTLVNQMLPALGQEYRYINADELTYREALSSQNKRILGDLLGSHRLLVIDEAQRVENIGLNLKIMVDNFPHATIIATGSASFDLANKIREPLTGRTITFCLYPISFHELKDTFGAFEAKSQLERWLVWGGYPAVITAETVQIRERLLDEIVGAHLYRDLLELNGIRHSGKIVDLLRLVAFQIGQEVSLTELAGNISLNRQTVERYLDLLEKVFVIYRVNGFSRNLRKEISKSARFYFIDNGVRNSLIQNFNPLRVRNDTGQLWENYLMIERRKANLYAGRATNTYFWRTYDQKEIDLIEERGGKLFGYEFKWQGEAKRGARQEFTRSYPNSEVQTITRDNYEDFLNGDQERASWS
jgi:hypothetical protein